MVTTNPHEVMSGLQEPAKEQGTIWIAEAVMSSAQLLQDPMSGATYIQYSDLFHEPSGLGGYSLHG